MGTQCVSMRRCGSAKVCDSGDWTCSCGKAMAQEANFCSHCGRRSLRLLQSTFEADSVKMGTEISQLSSEEATSIPEDDDCNSSDDRTTESRHSSPLSSIHRRSSPLPSAQSVSASDRERDHRSPTSSPKRSWNWARSNSPKTSVPTPSVYRGWLKSKVQADVLPSDVRQRRERFNTSDSEPDSPRGTPARRPSYDGRFNMLPPRSDDSSDMLSLLTQTLKHSGSLMVHFVRMRVLVLPTNLTAAHNTAHKADLQMPLFDAKVDFDNLLTGLLNGMLDPCRVSMQRVSFMGTDWLGIRLDHQTHAECITFCICVAALLNIGKSTSRTVVIEACGDNSKHCPGFACIPTTDRSSDSISTFFDYAKDIRELTEIICNEPAHSQKKVAADLKKWCQKSHRHLGDGRKKTPRFSLRRMVESLEQQLTALTPTDGKEFNVHRRPSQGDLASQCRRPSQGEVVCRNRRPSQGSQGAPRSRRKSCPALRTQMAEPVFTGICESDEEQDELPLQKRATLANIPTLLPMYSEVSSSSCDGLASTINEEANQVPGDTSQDRRRYSTGNMQCQRRRSGQLIDLRRCSSSTLE